MEQVKGVWKVLSKSVEFYCIIIILLFFMYILSGQKSNLKEYWERQGISVGDYVFLRPHMEAVLVVGIDENSVYIQKSSGSTYKNEWVEGSLLVPNLEKQ